MLEQSKGQTIRDGSVSVEYTSKPLSGWGGLSLFFEFLSRTGFLRVLDEAVPRKKRSNNVVDERDVVMSFLTTVLVGGSRFAHMERVRHDEVIRCVSGIKRMSSADAALRFFGGLTASESERMYELLQQPATAMLKSNYQEDVLDLDSTLLARFGSQQGVNRAFNSNRSRVEASHHPLLGMLSRSKHIAHVWLRDGSASTLRGAAEFVDELLARLPEGFRITALRADSGFHSEAYLRSFEGKNLPYIVSVRMHPPIQRRARAIGEEEWKRLREGVEIAEVMYEQPTWARPRRLIFLRREIKADSRGKLFQIPLYEYDALVTSLSMSPGECVLFYDQRGDCENTIKEFKNDFGAKGFCTNSFIGTEAAFRLLSVLFNLLTEFKRRVLRNASVTLSTVRMKLFVIGAVLGRRARQTVLRLGPSKHWSEHFSELLERLKRLSFSTAPQLDSSPG